MGDNVGQQAWGLLMMFCCDGRGWVVIDDAGPSPTVGFLEANLKNRPFFGTMDTHTQKCILCERGEENEYQCVIGCLSLSKVLNKCKNCFLNGNDKV